MLKTYTGTKTIKAAVRNKMGMAKTTEGFEPMDVVEGYDVYYPGADGKFDGPLLDGAHYKSWSPKDVFESCYVEDL